MCNTVGVAVLIGGMLALPLAMVSIGVKYLSECPKQPKIPVYLLVGGCFGILKLVGSLWQNIQYRQFNDVEYFDDELEENGRSVATADTYKMMDVILTLFLLSWLCAGSYWVFSVWQPHFTQLLHEPSNWCDKTVYLFAVYQIFGCYFLIGLYILIFGSLACCYKYTTLFEANID